MYHNSSIYYTAVYNNILWYSDGNLFIVAIKLISAYYAHYDTRDLHGPLDLLFLDYIHCMLPHSNETSS